MSDGGAEGEKGGDIHLLAAKIHLNPVKKKKSVKKRAGRQNLEGDWTNNLSITFQQINQIYRTAALRLAAVDRYV